MYSTPQKRLVHLEKTRGDHAVFHQPVDRQWNRHTWREAVGQARRMAAALAALGLQRGDRVAILSKNCAHWFIADFAIMLGGYVSVPIYPTANARTVEYVLQHSESKACFNGKLDGIDALQGSIPEGIRTVAFPYPTLDSDHQWSDLVAAHEPLSEVHEPALDEVMTLLYTSGSTGNPKAAVHTYENFAFAGTKLGEFFGIRDGDRVLSYLPLAHCTERAYVEATLVYQDCELNVFFAESLATFLDDLRQAHPSIFGSVPRLWKRFQLGAVEKIPAMVLDVLLKIPIVRGMVAKMIREGLGLGSARWVGSGTAPIAPALLQWYERIGLPMHEGWGMTESFAYGTSTAPGAAIKLGTIGKALPGVDLEIGDAGEILMKCPCLMTGYFKEPELTKATFTDEGYLRTGDRGEIDAEGFVKITGRTKEIFKTAKGKYVAPVPIESLLAENELVELVCVLGLGMTQPVALVQLAEGASFGERTKQRLTATLEAVNAQLETHEKLDRIMVVRDPWTPENGMLTPTLKLKRDLIEDRYSALVAGSMERVVFEPAA